MVAAAVGKGEGRGPPRHAQSATRLRFPRSTGALHIHFTLSYMGGRSVQGGGRGGHLLFCCAPATGPDNALLRGTVLRIESLERRRQMIRFLPCSLVRLSCSERVSSVDSCDEGGGLAPSQISGAAIHTGGQRHRKHAQAWTTGRRTR